MREITKWVVEDTGQKEVFWPSEEMKRLAWVNDASLYRQADEDPVAFWAERARDRRRGELHLRTRRVLHGARSGGHRCETQADRQQQ